MNRHEPQVCLLCGYEEGEPGEVSPAPIRFASPRPGEEYGWTRRCHDRAACRARADAAGAEWIVEDRQAIADAPPAPPTAPKPEPEQLAQQVATWFDGPVEESLGDPSPPADPGAHLAATAKPRGEVATP